MQLKIIHKGLLLLLAPFVIEVILFGLLFTLNQKAEERAIEERYRTQFIHRINNMLEDSGVAWTSMILRIASPHGSNRSMSLSPAQYSAESEIQLLNLRAIPYKSINRDKIIDTVSSMRNIQSAVLKVFDDNSGAFGNYQQMPLMVMRIKEFQRSFSLERHKMYELKLLLALEQKDMDDALAKQRSDRETIKALLIACFVFQILLTVVLIALFLNNITSRLAVLVKNAHLLPSGEELKVHVEGDDEIAYLDNVIHGASESLKEAKQNRQSIMNMIAHDIRSPLLSSNLLLDKLNGEIKHTGLGVNTSGRLKATFTQLNILVEDLLAIDKLESGTLELDLELTTVRELVQEAVDTAQPQADKRRVQITNKVGVGEVVLDRGRILQVLNNYLANAIKYSPDNGVIDVSATFTANKATITVTDQGKGISADDLPFVFDKFFQSADATARQGYGLGLAICQLIVQSHDGEVGVTSKPGQGSSFWFNLPVDA